MTVRYAHGWDHPIVYNVRIKIPDTSASGINDMLYVIEVNEWCANSCKGRYWKGNTNNPVWHFDDDEDYTAFILRWVQ